METITELIQEVKQIYDKLCLLQKQEEQVADQSDFSRIMLNLKIAKVM